MNLSLPLCERMKDLKELLEGYETLNRKKQYLKLDCHCLPPCRKAHVMTQVMPPMERAIGYESAQVYIYFSSREVEVLVEKESYDLYQMVGELGGCIGLFLGVSIISIYEFIAKYFVK